MARERWKSCRCCYSSCLYALIVDCHTGNGPPVNRPPGPFTALRVCRKLVSRRQPLFLFASYRKREKGLVPNATFSVADVHRKLGHLSKTNCFEVQPHKMVVVHSPRFEDVRFILKAFRVIATIMRQ